MTYLPKNFNPDRVGQDVREIEDALFEQRWYKPDASHIAIRRQDLTRLLEAAGNLAAAVSPTEKIRMSEFERLQKVETVLGSLVTALESIDFPDSEVPLLLKTAEDLLPTPETNQF